MKKEKIIQLLTNKGRFYILTNQGKIFTGRNDNDPLDEDFEFNWQKINIPNELN